MFRLDSLSIPDSIAWITELSNYAHLQKYSEKHAPN